MRISRKISVEGTLPQARGENEAGADVPPDHVHHYYKQLGEIKEVIAMENTKTTIFDLFTSACAELNVKVELLGLRGDLGTPAAGSIISDLLTRIFTICDCAAAVGLQFTYKSEQGIITSVKSSTGNTWCCKVWDPDIKAFCD